MSVDRLIARLSGQFNQLRSKILILFNILKTTTKKIKEKMWRSVPAVDFKNSLFCTTAPAKMKGYKPLMRGLGVVYKGCANSVTKLAMKSHHRYRAYYMHR